MAITQLPDYPITRLSWDAGSAGRPGPCHSMPPAGRVPDTSKVFLRLASAGVAVALLVGAAGRALERARFGATDQESVARVENELRQRFGASADTLGRVATGVSASRDLIRAATRDPAAARNLFDALTAALPDEAGRRTGITVYDAQAGRPVAWAGRVSDIPRERIDGPVALFVRPGALGPGLIRVEPVFEGERAASARLGAIVVEQLLGEVRLAPGAADTFVLSTSLVPVSLSTRVGAAPADSPYTFAIPSSGGQLLVVGDVSPADLAAAKRDWRRGTRAAILSICAATILLCAGTLIDVRRRRRDRRTVLITTAAIVAAARGRPRALLVRDSARRFPAVAHGAARSSLDDAVLRGAGLDGLESDRTPQGCTAAAAAAPRQRRGSCGDCCGVRGGRRDRRRHCVALSGLPPRPRGAGAPRSPAFLASPTDPDPVGHGVRAGAASCRRDLGRRHHYPSGDRCVAPAAVGHAAGCRRDRLAGWSGDRGGPRALAVGPAAARTAVGGPGSRRRLRRCAGPPSRPCAASVPGRPAWRAAAGPAGPGRRDVSLAPRLRDRGQGTACRHRVRSAGGEPAGGSLDPPSAGGARSDRRDAVAARIRGQLRRHRHADNRSGVSRVVAD